MWSNSRIAGLGSEDGRKYAREMARNWSSPNGQTPAATLYSAILREIKTKGKEARFKKADGGLFAING